MTAATRDLPRLLITMGDVAGVGPEIIARAWPRLLDVCQPIVVGDPHWLEWALRSIDSEAQVQTIDSAQVVEPTANRLPCIAGSKVNLRNAVSGQVSGAAGQVAFDFLCTAIDRTLAGEAAGIVTAPLHKEGLRAAGLHYPGHTEILAERCGVKNFAMVLALGNLAVAHVTLH